MNTWSQVNRYSFGIRIAWLRPVLKTLAVARFIRLAIFSMMYIQKQGCGKIRVRGFLFRAKGASEFGDFCYRLVPWLTL
jgi:hypothetical protein